MMTPARRRVGEGVVGCGEGVVVDGGVDPCHAGGVDEAWTPCGEWDGVVSGGVHRVGGGEAESGEEEEEGAGDEATPSRRGRRHRKASGEGGK